MRFKYNRLSAILFLVIAVFLVSCNDQWDSHYNANSVNKIDSTSLEFINSRSDLSIFAQMLKSTGYDSLLNIPQTFTVWAPNNTALASVDLKDTSLVRKLVENHITRFLHTTAGLKSQEITTMNNKLIVFAKSGTLKTFGSKLIQESDIATNNGIVHILSAYAPYKTNIWEFVNEAQGLDSLKKFLNELTLYEFDEQASYVDEVLVDSVMKKTNIVLDYLAALNTEDSIYTAILPNNEAWTEAYNRIFPYFNTLPIDGGVTYQQYMTKLNIVKDLYFRGKLNAPLAVDTIVSTNGNKFVNPNRLFANSQPIEMSNGISYISPKLNIEANESWFGIQKIEAEWSFYNRLTSNYNASTYPSIGTGFDISRGNYLLLDPSTNSSISKLFVKFPLPNTLSAKYNVYCVFVPTTIADKNDLRPFKVKFYFTYTDASGNQVVDKGVTVNNTLAASSSQTATFTTNPSTITKLLVLKDFELPFCNIMQEQTSLINVALKVENAASPNGADATNFNRKIRIDCIILEPAE